MTDESNEPIVKTLVETDQMIAWKAEEPDGETTYHIELNSVTLHFFEEEWNEFIRFIQLLVPKGK